MADDKKVRIEIPIVPSLDKKAARATMAEVRQLEKELGSIKVSFDEIMKSSRGIVAELRKMPSEIEKAGKATTKSNKKSKSSGGSTGGQANDPGRRANAEVEKSARFSIESQKRIENLQKQRFGAMLSIMKNSANLLSKTGYKSAAVGIKDSAISAGKATREMSIESGGKGGVVLNAIAKAGPMLTMAATAVIGFVKVLGMASDNQAKLNRALIEGNGSSGDFGATVESYQGAVRDLNDGILKSSSSFLSFGGNSEKAAKSIGAFAKESSGSILKTRNEMAKLGGRDGVSGGIKIFYQAAHSYGAALGMSAEQTGELMGKMSQDLGRNAQGSLSAMDNIVQAAAKSNMPMAKFMDIFHQVIPGVELYQNRLEELTGTIKLLSKNMSPKDVKNFMESFSNGFKGSSFKDRLKTALVVGVGSVNSALEKDFQTKFRSMAKEMKVDEDAMWQAAQKGERGMADFITAQELAGKSFTGTQKGEAMKLSMYERSRQRGGALNTAESMAGAGMGATYKIIQSLSKRFAGNDSGLREHVTKMLGVSDQQYDATRAMERSINKFQSELAASGGQLESASLQKGLEEIMTKRLESTGKLTPENLKKALMSATGDDLMQAAELSNYLEKSAPKALDMAEMQYNVSSSIGDKLENIVGWLLEQILSVLNSTLDVLNDTLMWIMGDKDQVKASKATQKLADDMISYNKERFSKKGSEGATEMMKMAADVISDVKIKGGIAREASDALYNSDTFNLSQVEALTPSDLEEFAKKLGHGTTGADLSNAMSDGKGAKGLFDLLGDTDEATQGLLRFTEFMAQTGRISETAKQGGKTGASRRPDAKDAKTVADFKDEQANADHNENFKSLAETQKEQLKIASESAKKASDLARSGMDMSSKQNDKSKAQMSEAMTSALAQQAAKEAYIDANPALAANKGDLMAQSGLMLPDQMQAWLDDKNNPIKPGHANGGSIDYDQVARIHKGEFVVPKGGMLVSGGGGGRGPKIGTMNITVHAKTDASPTEIANALHQIFSRE